MLRQRSCFNHSQMSGNNTQRHLTRAKMAKPASPNTCKPHHKIKTPDHNCSNSTISATTCSHDAMDCAIKRSGQALPSTKLT